MKLKKGIIITAVFGVLSAAAITTVSASLASQERRVIYAETALDSRGTAADPQLAAEYAAHQVKLTSDDGVSYRGQAVAYLYDGDNFCYADFGDGISLKAVRNKQGKLVKFETITEAEAVQLLGLEEEAELYKKYDQFGLTYDSKTGKLYFEGKPVRCFDDFYTVTDETEAGYNYFDESGTIDVYAVRDFTKEVKNADGSVNPAGTLTGIKAYTQEEFDQRDLTVLKNPGQAEALDGEAYMTDEEKEKMYAEYKAFGVEYDKETDRFFFYGKKVRHFQDILMSNGESPQSGKFNGDMRTFTEIDGEVDIYTVRDFSHKDENGNGLLTGIKEDKN